EVHFCASNVFKEAVHPGTVSRRIRPCEQLVFEILQTRTSDLQRRLEFGQAPRNSSVQRGAILWRNPLSIGLFAQLDPFQTVIPTQQVLDLSDSILGRVV